MHANLSTSICVTRKSQTVLPVPCLYHNRMFRVSVLHFLSPFPTAKLTSKGLGVANPKASVVDRSNPGIQIHSAQDMSQKTSEKTCLEWFVVYENDAFLDGKNHEMCFCFPAWRLLFVTYGQNGSKPITVRENQPITLTSEPTSCKIYNGCLVNKHLDNDFSLSSFSFSAGGKVAT